MARNRQPRDLFAIMRVHRPGHLVASPLARRLAANSGIDLTRMTGSGPHGRIMKHDVQAVIARPAKTTTQAAETRTPTVEPGAAGFRSAPRGARLPGE